MLWFPIRTVVLRAGGEAAAAKKKKKKTKKKRRRSRSRDKEGGLGGGESSSAMPSAVQQAMAAYQANPTDPTLALDLQSALAAQGGVRAAAEGVVVL